MSKLKLAPKPDQFGCGIPDCPNCVGKPSHPLFPQMQRVQELAGNLANGVIAATKHVMQCEHREIPFDNEAAAYIELHLQMARNHFAEVMIAIAQQEQLPRKEMKLMLKAMHADFTVWFQSVINHELKVVADKYDQIRSENATKQ